MERHQREWKKCLNSDSNRDPPRHRFAEQIEITRTTPTHHPQERRLDDGLPAHAIQSTRESSEDVTRTLDAPPSKVRSDIFPNPQRATSQMVPSVYI